jgi:hypothetical protein
VIRISAAFLASLLVASSIAAEAQTAVSVRPVASAGRTIHVITTQDLSISAAGLAGPGQIALQSSGTLAFTQVNKAFNDQGQMDAEITIEKLAMTRMMNGAPEDTRKADAIDPVGQKLVAVFDRTGKMGNVSAPKELQAHSASVRQLLSGAYGMVNGIPDMPMTVGETRTLDASVLPLRLPGAASAGAPLPKLSITLRAIDRVNGDRIARLTQNVESTAPADQLTVSGTGTIDVNIDKGFVTASAMNWSFAGALPGAGGSATQPSRVQATFKMTFNATE